MLRIQKDLPFDIKFNLLINNTTNNDLQSDINRIIDEEIEKNIIKSENEEKKLYTPKNDFILSLVSYIGTTANPLLLTKFTVDELNNYDKVLNDSVLILKIYDDVISEKQIFFSGSYIKAGLMYNIYNGALEFKNAPNNKFHECIYIPEIYEKNYVYLKVEFFNSKTGLISNFTKNLQSTSVDDLYIKVNLDNETSTWFIDDTIVYEIQSTLINQINNNKVLPEFKGRDFINKIITNKGSLI